MSHHCIYLNHDFFKFLDPDSFALLANGTEVKRAIVFVHGWGGNPVTTFSRMQELIASDAGYEDTDVFFMGYDSTRDETMLNAAYVANFIRTVIPSPPSALFRVFAPGVSTWFQIRESTTYESVDLVGHSLGGVVLRAAILDLLRKGLASSDEKTIDAMADEFRIPCRARLYLFAPAQGGARVAGLPGLAANIVGLKSLLRLIRGKSPTFQELDPGSLLLQTLKNDTDYYADRYEEAQALRATIAWAHNDSIVTSLPYRHDVSYVILNTSHLSVCKPTDKFRIPFELVSIGYLPRGGEAL